MSKIKSFLSESFKIAITGIVIYGIDYVGYGINGIRNANIYFNIPIYQSGIEIDKDLLSEKNKLGLEKIFIDWKFEEIDTPASLFKNRYGDYRIILHPSFASKITLRHELCHIKSFESNGILSYPDLPIFRQYEEWLATSCSLED